MPYEQMDSRYSCCFGPLRTHVEKGAYVIAFLGCALNIIEAIVAFLPSNGTHQQSIPSGVLYLFGAVMYLSIIAAQQKRNPVLYLPYLVFVGLGLIVAAFMCFLLVGLALAAPQSMIDAINKEHPEYKMTVAKFRLAMGLAALAYTFSICLNGWFYSVVFRAYKFMKEEPAGTAGVPPV